jgi:hypothetical protein
VSCDRATGKLSTALRPRLRTCGCGQLKQGPSRRFVPIFQHGRLSARLGVRSVVVIVGRINHKESDSGGVPGGCGLFSDEALTRRSRAKRSNCCAILLEMIAASVETLCGKYVSIIHLRPSPARSGMCCTNMWWILLAAHCQFLLKVTLIMMFQCKFFFYSKSSILDWYAQRSTNSAISRNTT